MEPGNPTHPNTLPLSHPRVGYFSMEIGLTGAMPTYSGGLGVLAGDTIKAAADLRVPLVATTLLHEQGYFRQRLGPDGGQHEEPQIWTPSDFMKPLDARVTVHIEGREVRVRAWQYDVVGVYRFVVPVLFLDTNLPENDERDRGLTRQLYGGDTDYRLRQEIVLGIGGVRMLRALGYAISRFHLNEGHSAMLLLELAREQRERGEPGTHESVRPHAVFTTHTPVAAGHDAFSRDQFTRALPGVTVDWPGVWDDGGTFSMTRLALAGCEYVNGVAKKHGEVSRHLFPGYCIDSITNGIHTATWLSPELQAMLDRDVPGWRADASMLRYVISLPTANVAAAHRAAKERLIATVNRIPGVAMDADAFTIGFARRATAYKRADLLFFDVDRLNALGREFGKIQIIYSGKAHPRDQEGKEIIKRIYALRGRLAEYVEVAYVEDYGMDVAKQLVAGVDVWLNTPRKPLEASGTSGMKAAANGVPSLSILDGWWIEGCLEGITGWAIGRAEDDASDAARDQTDASDLYGKLEHVILPLYHYRKEDWAAVQKNAIAINGSFFSTHRMLQEYVLRAYFP